MSSLNYVAIPPGARRLKDADDKETENVRPLPIRTTSLPHPQPDDSPTTPGSPLSPTKNSALNLLPSLLLSSTLPSTPQHARKPSKSEKTPLLSVKDPLSIQITTSNFKRFIERVGPVFWIQDRVEEIVMWRRGWKVTTTWIAAYVLICYFPILLLVLPQVIVIGTILATYEYPVDLPTPVPQLQTVNSGPGKHPPITSTTEGSVDWQGNITAIQNLMGLYVDAYAFVYPYLRHITHKSAYTSQILSLLFISIPPTLLLLSSSIFPLRAICVAAGVLPLLATNPYLQPRFLHILKVVRSGRTLERLKLRAIKALTFPSSPQSAWSNLKLGLATALHSVPTAPLTTWKSIVQRVVDDNNLTDECWNAEKREVELFENERLDPNEVRSVEEKRHHNWGKMYLRPGERTGWTRGMDGWSGVGRGGAGTVSSNLTFSLAQGWSFVETEDWRLDAEAFWACPKGEEPTRSGDSNGWVYTNDDWLEPRAHKYAEATTRRRRWTRRVWYSPRHEA